MVNIPSAALQRYHISLALLACLLFVPAHSASAAESALTFDFEDGELQGFVRRPGGSIADEAYAPADKAHSRDLRGQHGRYMLSTLFKDGTKSDGYMGVYESPVFVLTRPEVSFLIEGGKHDGTRVEICTPDGKELFRAHGKDDVQLRRVQWEASDAVGRKLVLRVVDLETGGWGHISFDDFRAHGRIDRQATRAYRREMRKERFQRIRDDLLADIRQLKKAIENLAASFPERYGKGPTFRRKLKDIETELDKKGERDTWNLEGLESLRNRLKRLTRSALLANPLIAGQRILYVERAQYAPDHHNTATMFVPGEINAEKYNPPGRLKTFRYGKDGERKHVNTLFDPGKEALARDPEVHYSGKRIVFALRREPSENYHIYEIGADGTGLRQLTAAPGACDIGPTYLPDGGIVFSSTRDVKYCGCNRHIMGNLYRMEGNGANIRQLSENILHDGHPTVMPDGRILYDRWEYTDRNFGDAQGLWTIRPDGSNCSIYWGNNTASPGGVIDARPIPGTHKVACIFGSCHDRPWGSLVVLDRRRAIDARGENPDAAAVRIWPQKSRKRIGKGDYDAFIPVNPKYEDPYPLTDPAARGEEGKYFLVSRMLPGNSKMGIYLVDVFGHQLLLHAEDKLGCFDPIPIRPHPRPQVLPSVTDPSRQKGTFYVQDVYTGTHMQGVERGSVEYLRVVQVGDKHTWTPADWAGQGVEPPAMNYHNFDNKKILGTVPVEDDGSAHFRVPAGIFVYFQLLDEDRMMVQSMRSATWVRPGETTGCIGCHDNRVSAPAVGRSMPRAVKREPSSLDGWRGEKRFFNYRRDVQPVFDRRCVSCHGHDTSTGDTLNLAGDKTPVFNTSYLELYEDGFRPGQGGHISVIGAGPAAIQSPRSWGSPPSRLAEVLQGNDDVEAHDDLSVPQEERRRVCTWLDLNAPYYPTFYTAYPDNPFGRSPMTAGEMQKVGKLTGVNLEKHPGRVNLERPALSPCLDGLDQGSEKYRNALAIINRAARRLEERPAADMPGFAPCPTDRKRRRLFQRFEKLNRRSLQALEEGRDIFDYGLEKPPE